MTEQVRWFYSIYISLSSLIRKEEQILVLALLHEYLHVLYSFFPLRYSVWIWLAVYLLRPCLVGLCFVHSPIFQPFQQHIGKVRDQLFLCKIWTRLLCCIQFRGIRKQPFGGLRCCVLLIALQNRDGCDRMVCWSLMSLNIIELFTEYRYTTMSSGLSQFGTSLLLCWGIHTSGPQFFLWWSNVLVFYLLPHVVFNTQFKMIRTLRHY